MFIFCIMKHTLKEFVNSIGTVINSIIIKRRRVFLIELKPYGHPVDADQEFKTFVIRFVGISIINWYICI